MCLTFVPRHIPLDVATILTFDKNIYGCAVGFKKCYCLDANIQIFFLICLCFVTSIGGWGELRIVFIWYPSCLNVINGALSS